MKTARFAVLLLIVLGLSVLLFLSFQLKKGSDPGNSKSSRSNTNTNVPKNTPSFLNSYPGFRVDTVLSGLAGPRDLIFDSWNNLLVSETSAGRVVALSPRQGMPTGNTVNTVLTGLSNPHGLAVSGKYLFVAEQNKVVRYAWDGSNLKADFNKTIVNLPGDGNHFTRSLLIQSDGRLFISIGSSCNVCNEEDPRRATVMVTDVDGNNPKIFSGGLRNSVFMAARPGTTQIWATEMGRDFLGDNLPPDEINVLTEGANYGWPGCFGNKVPDKLFNPGQKSGTCTKTVAPVYEICAHCAPLGLAFINSPLFPKDWQGDLLVSYHGSWNRSSPSGYKVVHLKVSGDSVISEQDFLTGFLSGKDVLGRPVGLAFDSRGYLYISDDKAGAIYKVSSQND